MCAKQTILITGASSGIGESIARHLSGEFQIIGIARDFSKSTLRDDNLICYEYDMSDLDGLPNLLKKINEMHTVHHIVCCAGQGKFASLEEFSYSQIRNLMDLNFVSQAYAVRAIVPGMKRRGYGRIIFIGSESALRGAKKGSVYCASKFALRGFAQALRDECSRSGVHVSIVNPGMVRTPFFDKLEFAPGEHADNYIEPEDVSAAIKLILHSRAHTVIDEINLSPMKKHVVFNSE